MTHTSIDLDKAIHEQVIASYEMHARFADTDDPEKAREYRERAEALRVSGPLDSQERECK